MIRAVLDTNVLLSGVLGYDRPASTPGELLRRWRRSGFILLMSESLTDELKDTLARPYFTATLTLEQRESALALFDAYAQHVEIETSIQGVAPDPDDDHILAAAINGEADYLVTGDQPLLRLGLHERVAIISPRAFLDILHSDAGSSVEPK